MANPLIYKTDIGDAAVLYLAIQSILGLPSILISFSRIAARSAFASRFNLDVAEHVDLERLGHGYFRFEAKKCTITSWYH
jgi:hypothetical protein